MYKNQAQSIEKPIQQLQSNMLRHKEHTARLEKLKLHITVTLAMECHYPPSHKPFYHTDDHRTPSSAQVSASIAADENLEPTAVALASVWINIFVATDMTDESIGRERRL